MGCAFVCRENAQKYIVFGKWEGWWDTKFWSNIRTVTLKKGIRKKNGNPYERGVRDALWRMHSYIQGVYYGFFLFTLHPVPSPGSHTAAETSFTSKSCTSPMLSPMLSKPSWRTLREGTSMATSKPRTLPKLRRNCTTMRQSENVLPSRTRPGMRGSSGKGWEVKKKGEGFASVFQKEVFLVTAGKIDTSFWPTIWRCWKVQATENLRPLSIQCWNTFNFPHIIGGKD